MRAAIDLERELHDEPRQQRVTHHRLSCSQPKPLCRWWCIKFSRAASLA
jgi:hypothetical protein